MLNFLNEFLSFVKSVVVNDDPNQVYKFSRDVNSELIICQHYRHETEFNFLPGWYISNIK